MPFIPHTDENVRQMLAQIGADSIDALFDEVPESLRAKGIDRVPAGLSEMQVARIMHARSMADGMPLNFIGAGAYEHHIPAAVFEITTRGEYYTAYTPYQAEASQGSLQLVYEYQSMMTELTGMDVSNASLYDGATALAEAVLMAIRANRKSKLRRFLIPRSLHPHYRETLNAIVRMQQVELIEIDYQRETGTTAVEALADFADQDITGLVIPQPNFFGALEDVAALTDWAHARQALVIGVVNPLSLALLEAPGNWGGQGADIACGEGQPLGIPLSSGGPYYGFLCCKQAIVRQMPGRIVGRTVDLEGREGFVLTLQAREQHIRRSKATSNICTNQGLMVTASTIFMSIVGTSGLERMAAASHANTRKLVDRLSQIAGVRRLFDGPAFHEAVIQLDYPVDEVLRALAAQNIVGGYDLAEHYPEMGQALLICATETKNDADIDSFVEHVERIVSRREPVKCPVQPNW